MIDKFWINWYKKDAKNIDRKGLIMIINNLIRLIEAYEHYGISDTNTYTETQEHHTHNYKKVIGLDSIYKEDEDDI